MKDVEAGLQTVPVLRVQAGQEVMTIQVPPAMEEQAKTALKKASQKLPSPVYIKKQA